MLAWPGSCSPAEQAWPIPCGCVWVRAPVAALLLPAGLPRPVLLPRVTARCRKDESVLTEHQSGGPSPTGSCSALQTGKLTLKHSWIVECSFLGCCYCCLEICVKLPPQEPQRKQKEASALHYVSFPCKNEKARARELLSECS